MSCSCVDGRAQHADGMCLRSSEPPPPPPPNWMSSVFQRNLAWKFAWSGQSPVKNTIFWDLTSCDSCKNWRFGGYYKIHTAFTSQKTIFFIVTAIKTLNLSKICYFWCIWDCAWWIGMLRSCTAAATVSSASATKSQICAWQVQDGIPSQSRIPKFFQAIMSHSGRTTSVHNEQFSAVIFCDIAPFSPYVNGGSEDIITSIVRAWNEQSKKAETLQLVMFGPLC
jgi:hypothetical protein